MKLKYHRSPIHITPESTCKYLKTALQKYLSENQLLLPGHILSNKIKKSIANIIPAVTVLLRDCKILDTFTSNKLNIIL
tara:strand:- start:232 stop:468 length:237 start_codon:yes stop_codon:yes gene_type:complete